VISVEFLSKLAVFVLNNLLLKRLYGELDELLLFAQTDGIVQQPRLGAQQEGSNQ